MERLWFIHHRSSRILCLVTPSNSDGSVLEILSKPLGEMVRFSDPQNYVHLSYQDTDDSCSDYPASSPTDFSVTAQDLYGNAAYLSYNTGTTGSCGDHTVISSGYYSGVDFTTLNDKLRS